MKLTTKLAEEIVGGLSKPSKMPGFAYSIPAQECSKGSKLRAVKGSVCEKCYALKGRYAFPNVKNALYKRLGSLEDPRWVEAMSFLINKRSIKHPYFRWHDSGDLQGEWHLQLICAVCDNTPTVKHWLPTREYKIVSNYINQTDLPSNLTIRLSAYMIDGPKPLALAKRLGVQISSVSSDGEFTCPSSKQGNSCGDCRACWDSNITDITYKTH
jgi:hypothetical protein